MNEIMGIKKYKAAITLEDKPVFILAANEQEAKTLLATKIMALGAPVNAETNLELAQVEFACKEAQL